MKQIFRLLILVLLISGTTAIAHAQEKKTAEPDQAPTPTGSPMPEMDEPALYTYQIEHDHRFGSGRGELRVTGAGFEFRGEDPKEKEHYQIWRDEDIKRLEFSGKEIRIFAYEAARYPLVPRQVPYIKGKKDLRIGSERKYVFRLVEGEVAPEVVSLLLTRFRRPLTTSVIPLRNEESGKLLFEIPVFYRKRSGGVSGQLRVFEEHAIFTAESPDQSRFWRYEDVRDIGRLGRWKFEIAAYESQFLSDGKGYIFDLKRPMTDVEYEILWTKIYERDRSPRLRRPVKPKRER